MKRLLLITVVMLLLAACAEAVQEPSSPALTPAAAMTLASPAFTAGQAIPAQYTCQGDDSSPALTWNDPPEGTQSLALIMDDPDAPVGTWVHWVVYNLPADARELAEGASKANATEFNLPTGAVQGETSFKRTDYGGPCPPSGTHRYFFRLYALDTVIDQPDLDKEGLINAMEGHLLAIGELMGTYAK